MTENKAWGALNAVGQLIVASIIWGVCCLPVFTIGPASTALYYCTVKVVRRGRGTVWGEFFRSFRENFWPGVMFNLGFLSASALVALLALPHLNALRQTGAADGMLHVCFGLVLLYIWLVPYVYPVLSRFAYNMRDVLKLSLYIGVKHFGKTALLLVLLAAVAALGASNGALLILLPGAYCYAASLLLEPEFKAASKPDDEGNYDLWYGEIDDAPDEDAE